MVRKPVLSFDQGVVTENRAALGGFERWKVGWRGSKLHLSGKKNDCWFTWCSLRAGKKIGQKSKVMVNIFYLLTLHIQTVVQSI